MNDAWGYDDNDNSQADHSNGPKPLRDAYEAQKEINKQILQELSDLRKERDRAKVSSVFSELGVPGAAELYTGEPDPEKAKEWAESMKAAFGTSNTQAATTPVVDEPVLTDNDQAAYQAAVQAGTTGGTPMNSIEAAGLAVQNANSIEELIRASQASQHLR